MTGTKDTNAVAMPFPPRFLRPKGHINARALSLLVLIGVAPLLLALCRVLALPGAAMPGIPLIEHMIDLGTVLNESFSLLWIPPDDREAILYLLLLPTGAVIVALARLTFGLRVLGLRVILIAIAFQEIGLSASLLLMLIVITTVAAVRPLMRRVKLPLYARTSIIVCLAAAIMVCALMIGPLAQSQTIWRMAFFPVIIMAMLAEGIAKTLASDNAVTAVWRLAWTLLLALFIAGIGQIPAVRETAIGFPELLITELVAIVFIAEFLDLRLLEHWPARLTRLIEGRRPWKHERPRIMVVRNRWNTGVINRLGRPAPAQYRKHSVQRIVDALRARGFDVRVCEGDMGLLGELREFLPQNPRTGAPGGMVLNLATGTQGNGRYCHVPAMLELAGIPYTGPDPVTYAHLTDRYVMLNLLQRAKVPIPRFTLMTDTGKYTRLQFPLKVRPRYEPDAPAVVAKDRKQLEKAVSEVLEAGQHEAIVEEAKAGRDLRVALLGNANLESLPLVERTAKKPRNEYPAVVTDDESWQIREVAYQAWRAIGCRDYARVDVTLTAAGDTIVADLKCTDILNHRGTFVNAAEAAGMTYDELLCHIVDEAWQRYGPTTVSVLERGEAVVVSLADRRTDNKLTAERSR